ncbi:MAG: uridine kinase [Terriglobales bacterium]
MPHIIGIGGPSCAGKTELSRRVSKALNAPILPIDAYYINLDNLSLAERAHFNFDEPTALDHYLLRQHIEALAAGHGIDRPTYDFTTHTRAAATERIEPADFVILEGLFALYWDDIRPFLRTKVFVDACDETCLARRTVRDVAERGRTPQSVLEQFEKTVRPMANLHVRPTTRWADVVVSGNERLEVNAAAVLRCISTHEIDAAPIHQI